MNPAAGVEPGPILIAVEHAEGLGRGWLPVQYWIALPVHRWIVLRRILIVQSEEKPVDSLAGLRRQDRRNERLFEHIPLFVDQEKEKRFVLDDRSAKPNAKLIAVLIVFRDTIKII